MYLWIKWYQIQVSCHKSDYSCCQWFELSSLLIYRHCYSCLSSWSKNESTFICHGFLFRQSHLSWNHRTLKLWNSGLLDHLPIAFLCTQKNIQWHHFCPLFCFHCILFITEHSFGLWRLARRGIFCDSKMPRQFQGREFSQIVAISLHFEKL